MSELTFDSTEQVLGTLGKLAQVFEEDGSVSDAAKSPDFIGTLKAVEAAVQRQGLISPNETFAELNLELVPLLQLPFYLGSAYQNYQVGHRVDNLRLAELYYLTFLDLMNHFEILPADLERIRESYSQTKKYDMQREEKIKLYKEEKQLAEKVALATNKQDSREVARLGLIRSCYRALNGLLFLPQELEMLAYRHKLETDPEARRAYEKARNQPIEPIKFIKLETGKETQTGVIQSKDIRTQDGKSITGFAHDGSLGIAPVQTTNVNTVMEQKQLIQDRLNQPGWTQPTMTLDQHDEMEYNLMMAKQKRGQEAKKARDAEKAKYGIEDSEDSENEVVSEAKTYKDRKWDDWKDANEKGSGNRNGR